MKKSIIAIICIILIVGSIGSVFCGAPLAPWADPSKPQVYVWDGQVVSGDQWMLNLEAQVAAEEAARVTRAVQLQAAVRLQLQLQQQMKTVIQ